MSRVADIRGDFSRSIWIPAFAGTTPNLGTLAGLPNGALPCRVPVQCVGRAPGLLVDAAEHLLEPIRGAQLGLGWFSVQPSSSNWSRAVRSRSRLRSTKHGQIAHDLLAAADQVVAARSGHAFAGFAT